VQKHRAAIKGLQPVDEDEVAFDDYEKALPKIRDRAEANLQAAEMWARIELTLSSVPGLSALRIFAATVAMI
jgi:hypothetical protein